MKTHLCNFVATEALIQKRFPGSRRPHPAMKPGIISADFEVIPSDCTTAFGRWLAERVTTTRRDDDLSILSLTLKPTEMDIALLDLTRRVTATSIRNQNDFERLLKQLEVWSLEKKAFADAYGDHIFQQRTVAFEWPVLGSRAAEGIESPAAYFDLCAARIRGLKPARVCLRFTGEEPPESLQI